MSALPAAYRQRFRVTASETGARGRLAPAALAGFLQEAAGGHAQALGVGMERLLEQGLAWMLQRLCVAVTAWPAEGDVVEVATWPTRFGGAAAERSFEVEDSTGGIAARAVSRWAVVDLRSRRAVRLPDFIRSLPVTEVGGTSTWAAAPQASGEEPLLGVARVLVGTSDLDVVGHANNTRYLEWALLAVPGEWTAEQDLAAFDVVFRQEAHLADALVSRAVILDDTRLGHELTRARTGEALATLETCWRAGVRS